MYLETSGLATIIWIRGSNLICGTSIYYFYLQKNIYYVLKGAGMLQINSKMFMCRLQVTSTTKNSYQGCYRLTTPVKETSRARDQTMHQDSNNQGYTTSSAIARSIYSKQTY
jgi:hypothetical protein